MNKIEQLSFKGIDLSVIIDAKETYNGKLLREFYKQKNGKMQLPKESISEKNGIYIFWWTGDLNCFVGQKYILKGAGGIVKEIIISQNWIDQATKDNAICLYVGKSSNIKERISKHIKIKSTGRLFKKGDSMTRKTNTESQLRYGLERIFPKENDSLSLLLDNVKLTIINSSDANSIDRFYLENYLIGHFKPLINLDIER